MNGNTTIDAKFHRRNGDNQPYSKVHRPPEPFKTSHGRFDIYNEIDSIKSSMLKTLKPEFSKQSIASSTKIDDSTPRKSESEVYDSEGGTLSNSINNMKIYPNLKSYQEMDTSNRPYFWKILLEKHGGKYAIIDNLETDQPFFKTEEDEPVNSRDVIVNKIEINTLIHGDNELHSVV